MTLLYLYVATLIFGGTFVMLSVVSGLGDGDTELEGDADVEAELDTELDADFDADLDGDVDFEAGDVDVSQLPIEFDLEGAGIEADGVETGGGDLEVASQRRFNPFKSFKFYTFTLAFFGLTGVIFETLALWSSSLAIFGTSVGMGLFAGLLVTYAMHKLSDDESGGITERDYLGASADVILPIEGRGAGKVRMQLRGRIIEMRAESADDGHDFDRGDKCFVLGVEGNVVKVIDAETVERQLTR